jgi:myo-inositol catabolism protein IolC
VAPGYDQHLFVLAFDHRGPTHQRQVFGVAGDPTPADVARITDAKSVVFEGFVQAVGEGAPADAAGILVDAEFGADVARKAKANGWSCAMPVERSGIVPLELEDGGDVAARVEDFDPTFTKVLVRYNPDGNAVHNERSRTVLQGLSRWLRDADRKLLCELIVPAEPAQLAAVEGDERRYEREVRPALMRRGVAELQDAGIEPDVWKLEGIDRAEDCEAIAAQARTGGRDRVGCVVLGAGAPPERVEHWLRTAAGVDGYLGFAVGRTIWSDPVQRYLRGSLSRVDAAGEICAGFLRAIAVYDGTA